MPDSESQRARRGFAIRRDSARIAPRAENPSHCDVTMEQERRDLDSAEQHSRGTRMAALNFDRTTTLSSAV